MKMKTLFVAAVLISISVVAYGKVKYVKTWKNPEAQAATWKGKKVVVFCGTLQESARQSAEQTMVRELTSLGIKAVPAYSTVPAEAEKNREMVQKILNDAGIVGALIIRVVDFQTDTEVGGGVAYYMGPSYNSFYGFWGTGWNVNYISPDIRSKTKVVVETLVYAVDQDKLAWTGTSETTNPEKADKVVKELISATGQELKKAGLVAK